MMTIEQMTLLAQDEAFMQAFAETDTAEEARQLFSEKNIAAEMDEIQEILVQAAAAESWNTETEELSEEALEAVVGGCSQETAAKVIFGCTLAQFIHK